MGKNYWNVKLANLREIAKQTYTKLPPPPHDKLSDQTFRDMFNRRAIALVAWHGRVMGKGNCNRHDAERACAQVMYDVEPELKR